MVLVDHGPPTTSNANCVLIHKERQMSNFGSEQFDEYGVRLIRDRALPCRMRKVWRTLALLQFLTAAAMLITDIYAHQPIIHENPLMTAENTRLVSFRFDMYLGIVCAVFQLIAAFIGLLPMGIPCRMNPPARYRSAHFLFSVFAACLMVIAAVSYGIVLSNISKDAKSQHGQETTDAEQRTRNVIFTFKILLSLLVILLLGALVNLAVVIAVCTAVRKCYRNCKVCCAEH